MQSFCLSDPVSADASKAGWKIGACGDARASVERQYGLPS